MVKLNEQEKRQQNQEETVKVVKEETKTKVVKEKKSEKINLTLEDLEIVLYPLITEKAVNMIDTENKLTFIVNDNATKQNIRTVIQEAYKVKVDKINIIRDRNGRKKAIIRLKKEYKAQDLATKLGVL